MNLIGENIDEGSFMLWKKGEDDGGLYSAPPINSGRLSNDGEKDKDMATLRVPKLTQYN